jgi:hypothetical protein
MLRTGKPALDRRQLDLLGIHSEGSVVYDLLRGVMNKRFVYKSV